MNYEILLPNSSFKECAEYIKKNFKEIYYVPAGYKIFDNYLDSVYEGWSLSKDYKYMPSDLLKSVDPICYQQEFLNWLDAEGYEEVKDDA